MTDKRTARHRYVVHPTFVLGTVFWVMGVTIVLRPQIVPLWALGVWAWAESHAAILGYLIRRTDPASLPLILVLWATAYVAIAGLLTIVQNSIRLHQRHRWRVAFGLWLCAEIAIIFLAMLMNRAGMIHIE